MEGRDVHAQDGCTTSDIEDNLVLEQMAVVVDRIAVGLGADFIFLRLSVSITVLVSDRLGFNPPTSPRGCLYKLEVSMPYMPRGSSQFD